MKTDTVTGHMVPMVKENLGLKEGKKGEEHLPQRVALPSLDNTWFHSLRSSVLTEYFSVLAHQSLILSYRSLKKQIQS